MLAFIAIILIVILFFRIRQLENDISHLQKNIELLSEKPPELTSPNKPISYDQATPSQEASSSVKVTLKEDSTLYHKTTSPEETPLQAPLPTTTPQAPSPVSYKSPSPKPATPIIKKKSWFNNEDWVGINLFNRLGALLIIVGTIAIAAFEGFPPQLRTGVLFALAITVIVLAELMNRKKPTLFSTGLSATGVALNYIAIAASFFALNTIGMYTALIACILATALGIYLATRYKAQVIGCFALIGGYLPIFALDPLNNQMMIGVMGYFIILALFSLILALSRKWTAMNIMGFGLTVLGASYLGWQASPVMALAYACFAFLLYTALPLLATFRAKEKFTTLDDLMIIFNTAISSLVIFLIAYRLDIQNIHAYLCLFFALIYGALAYLVKGVFNHKSMTFLFTLTGIAFFGLFVPFYFTLQWLPIFWLIQGTLLATFGVIRGKKLFEFSGLTILTLSALAILISRFRDYIAIASYELALDVIFNWQPSFNPVPSWQPTFDYAFFTLGTLIVLGCYIKKNRQWHNYELVYKLLSLTNIWLFTLYLIFTYTPNTFSNPALSHLLLTLWAVTTFGFAYLYYKIKLWSDIGTTILANVIHTIGLLFLWLFNFILFITPEDGSNLRLLINLVVAFVATTLVIRYYITEKRTLWAVIYKNINLVNIWLISITTIGFLIRDFFGVQLLLIILTFFVGYIVTRIPIILDKAIPFIAMTFYGIGLLWLWIFNSWPYHYSNLLPLLGMNAIVQVLALIVINDFINLCNIKDKITSLKIVILSTYFLLAVTQGMMVQGNIAFSNAIISIMYAVVAFAWIIIGFKIKSKPTRKAGLFLSMAAVVKLLVIDTWGLSTGMRIISYISLGLLLMLISFVYQKLSKIMAE
jgi:uncharacterized membrane protein